MRKLPDESAIVVVVENGTTAFGANFFLKFRMLVKLQ